MIQKISDFLMKTIMLFLFLVTIGSLYYLAYGE